jgi:putative transposase
MSTQTPDYHGYRFPPEIISYAVWLYHRFCLSFRDVEELLAYRGVTVSYETVRRWCLKFGPSFAKKLRFHQGRLGDIWHLDEVYVSIQGKRHYLWRAVDQAARRKLLPSVSHCQDRRRNNRAEVSHQPTRQREYQMHRFKSPRQAQRFLSVHGPINNLFRRGRHLLPARHYRTLRTQAFATWKEVTGLQEAA